MATYLTVELANGQKHTIRMTYLDRIAWEEYAVVRGIPVADRPITSSAYVAYSALRRAGLISGEFGQFRQQLIDLEETDQAPPASQPADDPTPANPDVIEGEVGDEITPTRPAPGDVPQ